MFPWALVAPDGSDWGLNSELWGGDFGIAVEAATEMSAPHHRNEDGARNRRHKRNVEIEYLYVLTESRITW